MSRIRTIKPDFFTDSKIAKKKPITRLFFIGLWCYADCEGRLEEDQERLKLLIVPYDKIKILDLLNDLQPDFILRYQVAEKTYIFIKNFKKHQRPHPKEAKSDIPSHLSSVAIKLNCKQLNYVQEGKGKEGVLGKEGKEEGKGSGEGKGQTTAPASFTPSGLAVADKKQAELEKLDAWEKNQ